MELQTERMDAVDHAWLEMDAARSPMIMSAVLELCGGGGPEGFARTIARRLLRHPRFRQRVDTTRSPASWVEDDAVDLGYHVRIRRVAGRAGDADLRRVLAEEFALELDHGRPLWRCTLVVRRADRIFVLFRAHHAMGDGMAMMRLLLAQDDDAPRHPVLAAPAPLHAGPLGGLIDRLSSANDWLGQAGRLMAHDLRHPAALAAQMRDGRKALAALRRVLALPEDQPERLRPALQGRRSFAWAPTLRLSSLKSAARRNEVRVNDLFLAGVTGALRRWLAAHHVRTEDHPDLRVAIPVDLRPSDDGSCDGNFFGLVLAGLPVSIEDRHACLRCCSGYMEALKASPEARALMVGLAAAGHLPGSLERRAIGLVAAKAVAVVSNLPGPDRSLTIGGMGLRRVVFWPPQTGGIGLGISLMSYAGQVTVGVTADRAVTEDPQVLADLLHDELKALMALPRSRVAQGASPGRPAGGRRSAAAATPASPAVDA